MKRLVLAILASLLYCALVEGVPLYGASETEKRGTNGGLQLAIKLLDNVPYVTLEIGSQKQAVNVVVDTGSNDLWVPVSTGAESKAGKSMAQIIAERRLGNTKFAPAQSATFKAVEGAPTTLFQYLDGTSAKGDWGTDTLTFGSLRTAPKVMFSLVTSSTGSQGILGLGPTECTATTSYQATNNKAFCYYNFPASLQRCGAISGNNFFIHIDPTKKNNAITFGGVDNSVLHTALQDIPLYSQSGRAMVYVKEFAMNDYAVGAGLQALLDTGSEVLAVPNDVFSRLAEGFPVLDKGDVKIILFGCENSLNLDLFSFDFGSQKMYVPVQMFLLHFEDNSKLTCGMPLRTTGAGNTMILGLGFFKGLGVRIDYDSNKVGLAYNRNIIPYFDLIKQDQEKYDQQKRDTFVLKTSKQLESLLKRLIHPLHIQNPNSDSTSIKSNPQSNGFTSAPPKRKIAHKSIPLAKNNVIQNSFYNAMDTYKQTKPLNRLRPVGSVAKTKSSTAAPHATSSLSTHPTNQLSNSHGLVASVSQAAKPTPLKALINTVGNAKISNEIKPTNNIATNTVSSGRENSGKNVKMPQNVKYPPQNIKVPPQNIKIPSQNIKVPTENVKSPPQNIKIPPQNIKSVSQNAPVNNPSLAKIPSQTPPTASNNHQSLV